MLAVQQRWLQQHLATIIFRAHAHPPHDGGGDRLAWLQRLDPNKFLRVHRSTIVRVDRVAAIGRNGADSWFAELTDGHRLAIGRTYRARVKVALKQ